MNTWSTEKPTENKYSITMIVQTDDYTVTYRGVYRDGVWSVFEYPDESSHSPLSQNKRVVAWCDVDTVPEWAKKPLPAL